MPWLSPPVPTMSTAPARHLDAVHAARIICAAPVISSTVSPRTRSAIRKAPICAGVASPAVIMLEGDADLVLARAWRRPRPSGSGCELVGGHGGHRVVHAGSGGVARGPGVAAARAEAGQLEEVGEQRVAVLGGDALGMELHAVHRDASCAAGP